MCRLTFGIVCLLCAAVASADEPPPVQLGALVRGFAIPAQGRPDVPTPGEWRQRVDLDDVNEYASRANDSESILLDGEAAELSYSVRYGLVRNWEVGLFVPLLIQGGGFLDSTIQSWHRAWGLPNGGREKAPTGRFLYQYIRNGEALLDVDHGGTSFGDVQLTTGYQVIDHLAARAMLKLPTGSATRLSGNDAFGAALWLDAGLPLEGFFNWLTLYASVGYSLNGRGHVLAGQQKRGLPFGGAGFRLAFTERWDARFQMYVDAPAYKDSQLSPLAHIGVPLTVTTSYKIGAKTTASIGFQEKANFLASPDFGILLGLSWD